MSMIKWRNETSHNYSGEIAETAIDRICNVFYPLMVDYYHKMANLSPHAQPDLFNQ